MSIMAIHFDYKHRCLAEKNVPMGWSVLAVYGTCQYIWKEGWVFIGSCKVIANSNQGDYVLIMVQ